MYGLRGLEVAPRLTALRKGSIRALEGLLDRRRLRREIDILGKELDRTLLPRFLIIGAPKCGTSWLSAALRRQPNVHVVPDEIEYFSSHIDHPLEWYLEHFRDLMDSPDAEGVRPENLIIGEKSAGYCGIPPKKIRLVRRLLPAARLILMIRDPVARHWSHTKRYFSKKRKQARGYNSLEARDQLKRFFERTRHLSEYSKMIERWTDVYPAEQFLVVSQEATFSDPAKTLERVVRHIGASITFDPVLLKQSLRTDRNRGPAVALPEDVKMGLEQMFSTEHERLFRVLQKRYPSDAIDAIGLREFHNGG